MTANDTRTCRDCGASFQRSRADVTVRCPACRASRAARKDAPKRKFNCGVCADDPRGIASRSAVDGSVVWFPCHGNAHRDG